MFWLIFSVTWRTTRLVRLNQKHSPPTEKEWAFGQILPLMMMAAPFILLFAPMASLYRIWQRRRIQNGQSYQLESIGEHSL